MNLMNEKQTIAGLDQLLDLIDQTTAGKKDISLDHIMTAIGNRSFGPLLLLAGLIVIVPILGDIPGVPSTVALIIILIAGQLIIGRDRFWLPEWLLSRSVKHDQLCRILRSLRPAARFLDRWTRPRWVFLTKGGRTYLVALACMVIALAMPPMELIPFSANGAGIALIAFGLALITHDGLLAVLALAITLGTFTLIFYNLF
jgi:hypothetical protein